MHKHGIGWSDLQPQERQPSRKERIADMLLDVAEGMTIGFVLWAMFVAVLITFGK